MSDFIVAAQIGFATYDATSGGTDEINISAGVKENRENWFSKPSERLAHSRTELLSVVNALDAVYPTCVQPSAGLFGIEPANALVSSLCLGRVRSFGNKKFHGLEKYTP